MEGCRTLLRRTLRLFVLLVVVVASSILWDIKSSLDPTAVDDNSKTHGSKQTITPTVQKKRRLPSLKNGGIIFFLHIPKAGGTTIRELIKYKRGGMRSRVNYIYLTGPREYRHTTEQMSEWLSQGIPEDLIVEESGVGQVSFIEYHALDRNCPTFLEMSQGILPEWKRQAKERNIPFFAFAILREPVSMAVSWFNFYRKIPQNPNRFDWIEGECTDEVFMEATIGNPQCLFLARNEDAYTKTGQDLRETLRQEDCLQSYEGIRRVMDWVGTTEGMRNETLPLLKDLLSTNLHTKGLIRNLDKRANPSTVVNGTVNKAGLSDKVKAYIERVTQWDRDMFNRAKIDYLYSSWVHDMTDQST